MLDEAAKFTLSREKDFKLFSLDDDALFNLPRCRAQEIAYLDFRKTPGVSYGFTLCFSDDYDKALAKLRNALEEFKFELGKRELYATVTGSS